MPTVVRPKHFGAPLGMYSHGMVAPGGEIVVVAGQVGMGEGGAVAVGDVGAQTRQALENVRAIVEAAGCTMGHIVRLQTFLTHAEDIPGFMAARGRDAGLTAIASISTSSSGCTRRLTTSRVLGG